MTNMSQIEDLVVTGMIMGYMAGINKIDINLFIKAIRYTLLSDYSDKETEEDIHEIFVKFGLVKND